MFQDRHLKSYRSISQIGFSSTARRVLERTKAEDVQLERPNLAQLTDTLAELRAIFPLAEDAIILEMMERHPDIVRIARTDRADQPPGIIALLPLTVEGAEALVTGAFSGIRPNPSYICRPGTPVAALYVWLVHMPGRLGQMLGAVAKAMETFLQEPAPIFSRAATDYALRVHQSAGFLRAADFYPECTTDLLVVLPEKSAPSKPQIDIRVARTLEDVMQVFSIRSATYIAEQFCLYAEEFDGNDLCSTHWLGKVNGDPAGCIRARFFADFVKIERLAVRAEYRNSRLSFQLVRAAIEHCQRKGYRTFFGHSRLDLQRFWQVFGFRPVAGRPLLDFANVKYAEMRLDLPVRADAITLEAPPCNCCALKARGTCPGHLRRPPPPIMTCAFSLWPGGPAP
ncbi:MAG: GNAT family N-acetyltransferase [Sphingomonadaceae bacterium]|jgi:predicted GNAT family N-acyltransferase